METSESFPKVEINLPLSGWLLALLGAALGVLLGAGAWFLWGRI